MQISVDETAIVVSALFCVARLHTFVAIYGFIHKLNLQKYERHFDQIFLKFFFLKKKNTCRVRPNRPHNRFYFCRNALKLTKIIVFKTSISFHEFKISVGNIFLCTQFIKHQFSHFTQKMSIFFFCCQ